MEEFIGFGLLALFITFLVITIKKAFSKKENLYEHEDEIILDNDMVHYGPFSGSLDKSYRHHIPPPSSLIFIPLSRYRIKNY
jgi:hypothetical protein